MDQYNFMTHINAVVDFLNSYIWTVLPYALFGMGLFFTLALKFLPFRSFKLIFIESFNKRSFTAKDGNLSSFQAFITGLASRIGMGNIAGVATAISLGGPGAVFWMWLTAFLGMSTSFAENSLSQVYKVRTPDGKYQGGPAFYIRQGLKCPILGICFSIALVFTYGFVFNSIQANQIVSSVTDAFGLENSGNTPIIIGLIIVAIAVPIIVGGIKGVALVSTYLVPVMAIVYITIGLFIVLTNINLIGQTFKLIIDSAFGLTEATAGLIGTAIAFGVKRGLYSNEAGMGSSPNASAAADVDHPADQGFMQMFGVFLDTVIVCSITAFVVLFPSVYLQTDAPSGAALVQTSMAFYMGDWIKYLMVIMVFLFAFTSIIGNFAYAIAGIKYVTKNKTVYVIFCAIVLLFVFWGSIEETNSVWNMADLFLAIMTFINLYAILRLSSVVFIVKKDFLSQYKNKEQGDKLPVFDINKYPELKAQLENPDIWSKSK